MIIIDTYRSFEELYFVQNEWDNFMKSIKAEVFLTFDWCRVWWKHYGKNRELYIFIFRNNGSICGILPMFYDNVFLGVTSIKTLRMLGTDFTPVSITVPICKQFLLEVIQSFITKIECNNKFRWELLHFGPICGRYDSFIDLEDACIMASGKKFSVLSSENGLHTYIRLAESWSEQLASLNKKQRDEIKRKYERLIKQGKSLECVNATPENFPDLFDEFVITHQQHWNNLGRPGHYRAWPSAYEFHREIASIQQKKGRLRFYQIMLDGHCIGYRYAYKFGDTYFCFLYARADSEPDNNIDFARIDFGEMVKKGLDEHVKWFDLMRGEYHHKMQLGGQLHTIRNIYIYPNRLYCRVKVPIFQKVAYFMNKFYYNVWRDRIAPKINVKHRPLWSLWIRTNTLSK